MHVYAQIFYLWLKEPRSKDPSPPTVGVNVHYHPDLHL